MLTTSLYTYLPKGNYPEDTLNMATELFFALEDAKRAGFLDAFRLHHGEESYDLLKNHYSGLKLLDGSLNVVYKKEILATLPPFLDNTQSLALIQFEIGHLFEQKCPNNQHISTNEAFLELFIAYIKEIDTLSFRQLTMRFEYYKDADYLEEIFTVEKYLFLQKLESLYAHYWEDIRFIWNNLKKAQPHLEKVTYFLPYFEWTFDIMYHSTDDVDRFFRFDTALCKTPKYEDILQEIFTKNKLPPLKSLFKAELEVYLAEEELKHAYHQQTTQNNLMVAEHDIQNIMNTYKNNNKITKRLQFNLDMNLKAGYMKLNIDTGTYWERWGVPILFFMVSTTLFCSGVLYNDYDVLYSAIFPILMVIYIYYEWK